MRQGRRLYNERQLARQVSEDLRVFEIVKPDLVVGDFRWSLTISAAVYGVTHAALANAYWSPFIPRSSFPVPDHPMVRLLGRSAPLDTFRSRYRVCSRGLRSLSMHCAANTALPRLAACHRCSLMATTRCTPIPNRWCRHPTHPTRMCTWVMCLGHQGCFARRGAGAPTRPTVGLRNRGFVWKYRCIATRRRSAREVTRHWLGSYGWS